MSEEKPARDYKGWISLIIGACAVWVAYESLNFQKDQAEDDAPVNASPENTVGPSGSNEGQHSYQESSRSSSPEVDAQKPGPTQPSDKHDKGNKNKKNK